MLHNRSLNYKINRFHERYLRDIYNDGHSSYESIHHNNLEILATEMFKVYTGSATDILNEMFSLKPPANYNLRNQQEFTVRPIKTVHF